MDKNWQVILQEIRDAREVLEYGRKRDDKTGVKSLQSKNTEFRK
jgi:hypothetical protein